MDFVFPISKFNMYIKLSLACTYMITENISGLLSLINYIDPCTHSEASSLMGIYREG